MTPSRSLLLAAFPPELAGFAEAPPEGWVTACTGVGAITAAVETARLLSSLRPTRVLFLGTCGAYGETPAVGEAVWATEAVATSVEEAEGRAVRPGIERTRWEATWTDALPFPAATVAVPPAVTRTEAGARALGALAGVEHLELTGVFAACAAAGVPCGAVLAVANRVGPSASEEWRRNHAQVSRGLAQAIRDMRLPGARS
ncbi:MAG TPA: hypothetical protein VK188_07240 [Holophaga sp.]|nr:hypothetical protein [Holophaga sp.]